jgi:hypothetical protein
MQIVLERTKLMLNLENQAEPEPGVRLVHNGFNEGAVTSAASGRRSTLTNNIQAIKRPDTIETPLFVQKYLQFNCLAMKNAWQ